MEACSLLVNLREKNAELDWAAVSGEDCCVTTLITAAKETTELQNFLKNVCCYLGVVYYIYVTPRRNKLK